MSSYGTAVASQSVALTARADLIISFSAAQSFSQGARNWQFAILGNGNYLTGRQGSAFNDTPNGRMVIQGIAAGNYTFELDWAAADSTVTLSSVSFTIEAHYNYGAN